MAQVILHHYPLSLFAEKIRRVLAYKKIPWRAVEQPMMAPKPQLTPLTGGYRRIPVMQIDAATRPAYPCAEASTTPASASRPRPANRVRCAP